LVTTPGKN